MRGFIRALSSEIYLADPQKIAKSADDRPMDATNGALAKNQTPRYYATRLAFMIPLTAWPVLIYFRYLGMQPWGRHEASATAINAPTLCGIIIFVSALSIVLTLFGKSSWSVKISSILFIILNFWLATKFAQAGVIFYT